MHFQWTVSVGNLIELVAFVGGACIGYTQIVVKLATLETRVEALWQRFIAERF